MSSTAENGYAVFQTHLGKTDEPGAWLQITQARIDQFADCTLDRQFIHVDPEACAKASPFGVPIAHGFLTLSLLTHLSESVRSGYESGFSGVSTVVNYGLEKVRFPSPVKVGARIRVVRTLAAADRKGEDAIQLTHACTVEIEGEEKPACVADWLLRLIYS